MSILIAYAEFSDTFFVITHVSDLCRLGLYREAEKQFRSALNHQEMVDTYLYLAKVGCDDIT